MFTVPQSLREVKRRSNLTRGSSLMYQWILDFSRPMLCIGLLRFARNDIFGFADLLKELMGHNLKILG
jgi:hypothetical protein